MSTSKNQTDKSKIMTEQVSDLFFFATPSQLRKSVHQVFFNYLNQKELVRSENFQEIASDFYFLINFLQAAEIIWDKKTTPNSKP